MYLLDVRQATNLCLWEVKQHLSRRQSGRRFFVTWRSREPSLLSELEYVVNLDLKSFVSV